MSDAELLAIPGVDEATVRGVREAIAAQRRLDSERRW
jgi:hypothetical protein